MKKSISKSFTYMFKEEGWASKLGYIFVLNAILWIVFCFFISKIIFLVSNNINPKFFPLLGKIALSLPIIFFFLFGFTILYFIVGYLAKCTQNVINYKEGIPVLPEERNNLLNCFILGAKKMGAIKAIQVLIQPINFLLGIPTLIFLILQPALNRIFCAEFNFDSFILWKKAGEIIRKNSWLFVSIVLLEFLLNIFKLVLIVGLFIFKIHFAIIALILSAYGTYIAFVAAYLDAIIGEPKEVKEEIN